MAVFFWRYINVPQNWGYVVSWPSIALLILTVIPEILYPFVFRNLERKLKEAGAEKKQKTY